MFKDNKDLKGYHVLILSAMLFASAETLSIELNYLMKEINIFGYQYTFNVSLIFFCVGFFILDLISEVFGSKICSYFIYAKIFSQGVLYVLGMLAIKVSDVPNPALEKLFGISWITLVFSIIATFCGYHLTNRIMSYLRVRLNGRYLPVRYMASTLPGELVFSLTFSVLAFHRYNSLHIFVDLAAAKIVISVIFSIIVWPITILVEKYMEIDTHSKNVINEALPFI